MHKEKNHRIFKLHTPLSSLLSLSLSKSLIRVRFDLWESEFCKHIFHDHIAMGKERGEEEGGREWEHKHAGKGREGRLMSARDGEMDWQTCMHWLTQIPNQRTEAHTPADCLCQVKHQRGWRNVRQHREKQLILFFLIAKRWQCIPKFDISWHWIQQSPNKAGEIYFVVRVNNNKKQLKLIMGREIQLNTDGTGVSWTNKRAHSHSFFTSF